MTAHSQNGYPADDRSVIRSATIDGTDIRVAVRTGPAGDLLLWAAARWHTDVEPLRAPDGVLDCWGYAERTIRGSSTTLSNHSSGTALDLRARTHPLGVAPAATFNPAQITAVHRIVDAATPCLRWGGDYGDPARGGTLGSRPDGMHLEVIADEASCAAVLARLTTPTAGPELVEDDAMTPIPITLDAARSFHLAFGGEAGGGSQLAARGWVMFGSTWGGTGWSVTALAADGTVLAQWGSKTKWLRTPNNTSVSFELPAGTRAITSEGVGDNDGTRPWLSYGGIR